MRLVATAVVLFAAPWRRVPTSVVVAQKSATTTTKTTTTANFLFNLDDDPTEDVNLWDAVEYVNLKAKLAARLEYWMQLRIDPQVPDTTGADEVYTAAGGYAPWLETPAEAATPLAVERKYDGGGSPQPHIVFVLVDDWGWVRGACARVPEVDLSTCVCISPTSLPPPHFFPPPQ